MGNGIGVWAAILLGALALYSCSGRHNASANADYSSVADTAEGGDSVPAGVDGGSEDEVEPDPPVFDEDRAREVAEEEVANDTYTGIGSSYGCTDDCSGHEAGFRYRAEHGYAGVNPDSPSFNEGGEAFDDAVEARVEEKREAHENGEHAGD